MMCKLLALFYLSFAVGLLANPIHFGDKIKLTHASVKVKAGIYYRPTSLYSHSYQYYHDQLRQQQVVGGYTTASAIMYWIIKDAHGTAQNSKYGKEVKVGDTIRLEHEATHKNLHHFGADTSVRSPNDLGGQVACFGADGQGDSNDNWVIQCVQDDGSLYTAGTAWDSAYKTVFLNALGNDYVVMPSSTALFASESGGVPAFVIVARAPLSAAAYFVVTEVVPVPALPTPPSTPEQIPAPVITPPTPPVTSPAPPTPVEPASQPTTAVQSTQAPTVPVTPPVQPQSTTTPTPVQTSSTTTQPTTTQSSVAAPQTLPPVAPVPDQTPVMVTTTQSSASQVATQKPSDSRGTSSAQRGQGRSTTQHVTQRTPTPRTVSTSAQQVATSNTQAVQTQEATKQTVVAAKTPKYPAMAISHERRVTPADNRTSVVQTREQTAEQIKFRKKADRKMPVAKSVVAQ